MGKSGKKKQTAKVMGNIVFGLGHVGVQSGIGTTKSGNKIPFIDLSVNDDVHEVGSVMNHSPDEVIRLAFSSLKGLEVLQLAINDCKDFFNSNSQSHDTCPTKHVIDSASESINAMLPKVVREGLVVPETPYKPIPSTLFEGDWFHGTEEQYRKVAEIIYGSKMIRSISFAAGSCKSVGFMVYYNHTLSWQSCDKKTQLTPEEFIRRAENTFKTK